MTVATTFPAAPYRPLWRRWRDGAGDMVLAVLLVLIPPLLFGIAVFALERIVAAVR